MGDGLDSVIFIYMTSFHGKIENNIIKQLHAEYFKQTKKQVETKDRHY
jgi:hypothetical protein